MLIRLTENVRRSEPRREKPSASLDSSSSVTSGTVYRCCGLLGEQAVLSLRRGRSGQLLVWAASWFLDDFSGIECIFVGWYASTVEPSFP